jgi:hypothetical protein
MKTRFTVLVLVLASTAALAQQAATAKPTAPAQKSAAQKPATSASAESAKIADIRRLLELTGSRDMVNQMKTVMMAQFKQNAPSMPPEMFDEMMSELKAEDLEESMIPVYSKHFTASDIKQLIAFYQSPFGRKVMREMPSIISESNEVGIHWGQDVVSRVAGRWRDQGKITQRAYDQLMNASGTEDEH